jgi:hypothetical protein
MMHPLPLPLPLPPHTISPFCHPYRPGLAAQHAMPRLGSSLALLSVVLWNQTADALPPSPPPHKHTLTNPPSVTPTGRAWLLKMAG